MGCTSAKEKGAGKENQPKGDALQNQAQKHAGEDGHQAQKGALHGGTAVTNQSSANGGGSGKTSAKGLNIAAHPYAQELVTMEQKLGFLSSYQLRQELQNSGCEDMIAYTIAACDFRDVRDVRAAVENVYEKLELKQKQWMFVTNEVTACKQLYERLKKDLDPLYHYLVKPLPISAAQDASLRELLRLYVKSLQAMNSIVDKSVVEKQRWWLGANKAVLSVQPLLDEYAALAAKSAVPDAATQKLATECVTALSEKSMRQVEQKLAAAAAKSKSPQKTSVDSAAADSSKNGKLGAANGKIGQKAIGEDDDDDHDIDMPDFDERHAARQASHYASTNNIKKHKVR